MSSSQKELDTTFLDAAKRQNFKIVEECLAMGANTNTRDAGRVTAMHVAAERGDLKLASMLVAVKGTNLNPFTAHAYTPLIIACNSRQHEFVEFLLSQGADVNLTERFGKSALHHVTVVDIVSIAAILLAHGARMDIQDAFCQTPLSIAVVDRSYLPMVKLLVEAGANVNYERSDLTIHILLEATLGCNSEKNLEVIAYILENGADVNVTCPVTDRNALHFVAITGYLPLARLLHKWNTNANKRDFDMKTPLDIAVDHEHLDMSDFLEEVMVRQRQQIMDDEDMARSIISIHFS